MRDPNFQVRISRIQLKCWIAKRKWYNCKMLELKQAIALLQDKNQKIKIETLIKFG